MVRWRNIKKYGYRSSAKYFGGRAMRGRSYRKGGFGVTVNLPLVAGVGLGWFAPRMHPMQDLAITTLAVLPIRLPYNLKHAAQGYVLGMIAKGFIGSGGPGTVTASDFA